MKDADFFSLPHNLSGDNETLLNHMPLVIERKNKLIFNEKGIKILNDDILTTKNISPSSVDLIITSPPYNVDIDYNSHNDKVESILFLVEIVQSLHAAFNRFIFCFLSLSCLIAERSIGKDRYPLILRNLGSIVNNAAASHLCL